MRYGISIGILPLGLHGLRDAPFTSLAQRLMPIPKPTWLSLNTWQHIQTTANTNTTIYNPHNYQQLQQAIAQRWQIKHGDSERWQQCVDTLPIHQAHIKLHIGDTIVLSSQAKHSPSLTTQISTALMGLSPWRKGPFIIFNTPIDSEWKSDWKWKRLQKSHLDRLMHNANILDIGCGNGYYGWRMMDAGAKSVIGIEGSLLLHYQFSVCKMYRPQTPIMLFPIRFESLPTTIKGFDLVVSMGVLSHTKSPFDHLKAYRERLKKNATLILETLIIDQPKTSALYPQGRYAKMNNIFVLPSPTLLIRWLEETGFHHIHIHDINQTTTAEQRPTQWMGNESLQHFLDPESPTKTIEGYPAPTRLLLTAKA